MKLILMMALLTNATLTLAGTDLAKAKKLERAEVFTELDRALEYSRSKQDLIVCTQGFIALFTSEAEDSTGEVIPTMLEKMDEAYVHISGNKKMTTFVDDGKNYVTVIEKSSKDPITYNFGTLENKSNGKVKMREWESCIVTDHKRRESRMTEGQQSWMSRGLSGNGVFDN